MLQISFHSDLGEKNYIHSIAKNLLESQIENARVSDIFNTSHQSADLEMFAYNILASIHYFPANSIHVFFSHYFSINSKILITKLNDQYIIAPDNGILTIIDYIDYSSKKYEISMERPAHLNWVQFITTVIAEICSSIQKGTPIDEIGTFTNQYKFGLPFSNGLQINDHVIYYRIIYINNFSNAITNFHINDFKEHIGDKPFKTSILPKYEINRLSENYYDVDDSTHLGALFNDLGFLEFFLYGGMLCTQFKINKKNALVLKLEY